MKISTTFFAAKGVPLRAPLKPQDPADAHVITCPLKFVSVNKVLLKVAFI